VRLCVIRGHASHALITTISTKMIKLIIMTALLSVKAKPIDPVYPMPTWNLPSLSTKGLAEKPYFSHRHMTWEASLNNHDEAGKVQDQVHWFRWTEEQSLPNDAWTNGSLIRAPGSRDAQVGVLVTPPRHGKESVVPALAMAFSSNASNVEGSTWNHDGIHAVLFHKLVEFEDADNNGVYNPDSDTIVSAVHLTDNWKSLKLDSSSKDGDSGIGKKHPPHFVQVKSESVSGMMKMRILLTDTLGIEDSENVLISPRSLHFDVVIRDYKYKSKTSKLAVQIVYAGASPRENVTLGVVVGQKSTDTIQTSITGDARGYLRYLPMSQVVTPGNPNKTQEDASLSMDIKGLIPIASSDFKKYLGSSPLASFLENGAMSTCYLSINAVNPSYATLAGSFGMGIEEATLVPDVKGGHGVRNFFLALTPFAVGGILGWVYERSSRRRDAWE
jgi:hypothetical protein